MTNKTTAKVEEIAAHLPDPTDVQEGGAKKVGWFRGLVNNVVGLRREIFRKFFDPRRDINKECGYPDQIDHKSYDLLFDRHCIAGRVVEVLPKESWQVHPVVYEEDDPSVVTPFEKDWAEVCSWQGPIPNHYVGDYGSMMMETLKRADIMCGIGRYGVIVLGLDDQKPLNQPCEPSSGMKVTSIRVMPERYAVISKWEADKQNPRYGMPSEYLVTFYDVSGQEQYVGAEISPKQFSSEFVHWSRIVHVVDNVTSSDVYGVPRMQQVYDQLMDLRKLYGGSAEMYWRGAFPGISFESHPNMSGDVEVDEERTKDMAEDYMNGLQRYLSLVGMTAKSLAPQVVDPTPQIFVQIQAICIKIGIPMRVFMGSERGELASGQDDAAWNDRLRERQKSQITPRVIIPLVNHLIWLKILSEPKKGFCVWWPDLTSQTGQEKSTIAFQRTQALVQYVKGEGWRVVAPLDFLVKILGFEEKEAMSIWKNVQDLGYANLVDVKTGGRQTDYTNLGGGAGGYS